MSIVFACGAECGINVQGTNVGGGLRHWDAIVNTVAIDTSVFRSGARSYRFDAASSQPEATILGTSGTVVYVRFYFRVTDATPSTAVDFFRSDGNNVNFTLSITTGGVLQFSHEQATPVVDYSGTLVADEWYGVEMQIDGRSGANVLIDWRVWRASTGWVDQAQFAATESMSSSEVGWGIFQGPTSGFTFYVDDIVIGVGSTIDADWSDTTPKSGEVKILRPSADLAHSFSASGNFKYNNVTNFDQTSTIVYSYLDDYPMTQTTNFISQNVTSSGVTKYCQVDFPTESTYTEVHGVMPVWVVRAAATQACEMNIRASDNGTNWTNLIGNWGATGQDVSETSNLYRRPAATFAPPSGGSWNQTKVNGLRMQFGMSDDISPVPYVMALAFEVAWLESAIPRVPWFSIYPQLLAH